MFNPVHIKSEHDKDEETGLYTLEIIATFDNYQICCFSSLSAH